MTKKYHITEEGKVKPCRARKKPCPIGGDHYIDPKIAQKYAEKKLSQELPTIETLTRTNPLVMHNVSIAIASLERNTNIDEPNIVSHMQNVIEQLKNPETQYEDLAETVNRYNSEIRRKTEGTRNKEYIGTDKGNGTQRSLPHLETTKFFEEPIITITSTSHSDKFFANMSFKNHAEEYVKLIEIDKKIKTLESKLNKYKYLQDLTKQEYDPEIIKSVNNTIERGKAKAKEIIEEVKIIGTFENQNENFKKHMEEIDSPKTLNKIELDLFKDSESLEF